MENLSGAGDPTSEEETSSRMYPWWVIVLLVCFHVCAFFGDAFLLYWYEHPDDSKYNQGLLAKCMVMLGLQLSWWLVMGFPTDAWDANRTGVLAMDFYWLLAYLCVALFLSFPLPFSAFYYQADSDPRATKTPAWKKALCYSLVALGIVALLVGLLYIPFNVSNPPMDAIVCPSAYCSPKEQDEFGNCQVYDSDCSDLPTDDPENPEDDVCIPTYGNYQCHVGFLTYLIIVTAFVGFVFYIPFLGVGFASLPLDLLVGFVDRPKPIDFKAYTQKKKELGEVASGLKEAGLQLKTQEAQCRLYTGLKAHREKAKLRKNFNKFRQSVYLLERDYTHLNVAMKERGENPVYAYTKLILGILACIMSFVWIVHICIYMIIPVIMGVEDLGTGFLNDMLDWGTPEQDWSYFIKFAIYCIFIIYPLICTIAGCFKFGMRIFLCYPIQPLKKGETYLDSFLFNVFLILISCCAIPQFSHDAFRGWSSGSTADQIFGEVAWYMPFFGGFARYCIFYWGLVIWFITVTIFLMVKPRDKIAISVNYEESSSTLQAKTEEQMKPPDADGSSVPLQA